MECMHLFLTLYSSRLSRVPVIWHIITYLHFSYSLHLESELCKTEYFHVSGYSVTVGYYLSNTLNNSTKSLVNLGKYYWGILVLGV